jgi:beta-lactamase regulating signal transducer with metallopeptidase domain
VIAWALEALAASAALMIVVLLVRQPVRRLFGPQIAYALWALPLLRLTLPPLPAGWSAPDAMPIARASEVVTVLVGAEPIAAPVIAATVAPAPMATLPWGEIVLGAWLFGAAIFFVLHLVRHRRFCRRLLSGARLLDRVGKVRVIETPAAAGPLAFGTARRFVAFPDDFADRYDADERELALAHELGHHARGDLIANWAALAVLAVHWFNPLAWHAFRAFRCDQELANDARVLAGRSRTDRHIYACAIVKAAHGGALSAACHLHTITDLKGRLRMLNNTRLSRTRQATGALAMLGAVSAGLIVTASGTRAAAALTAKVESATGVQLAAPPTPPAPPAVPMTASARPAVPPVPPAPKPGTRTTRHVVIVKDGKTTRYDGDAAAAYIAAHPVPVPPIPATPPLPPMPTVVNRDCTPATGSSTMTQTDDKGRRTIIICRNRINQTAALASQQAEWGRRQAEWGRKQAAFAVRQAAYAERQAEEAKRTGLRQAVASIRLARKSITAEPNLTEEQRRDALAGLDDAMRELGEQMRP